MFPVSTLQRIRLPGFPRVRGDVPAHINTAYLPSQFSPRARGCSLFELSLLISGIVFPACAGMFLRWAKYLRLHMCFPRVRGDVPSGWIVDTKRFVFSPRARGCSQLTRIFIPRPRVFPACAGMFRLPGCGAALRGSFPRVRGDVPRCHIIRWRVIMFSPRARGCSCP